MKLKNKFMKRRSVFALSVLFFVATVAGIGLFVKDRIEKASAASTTFNSGVGVQMAGITAPPITGANGAAAWCFDIDKDFPTGQSYSDNGGEVTDPVIKGILYYGYGGVDNSLRQQTGVNEQEARFVTQLAVWKRAREAGLGQNSIISANRPALSGAAGAYYDALKAKTYTNGDFRVIRWTSGSSNLQSILTTEYNPAPVVPTPQGYSATITITKSLNGTGSLAGVVFEASTARDFSADVRTFAATNNNGLTSIQYNFQDSAPRTIYVREKTVPDHMIKSDEVKTVTVSPTSTHGSILLTNNVKPTTPTPTPSKKMLKIVKKGPDNEDVGGVEFDVSYNGTTVRTVTNTLFLTGLAIVRDIPASVTEVVVREVSAPAPYIVDSTPRTIRLETLTEDTTVTIVNQKRQDRQATASIVKTDETGAKVSGVVFEVSEDRNFTQNVQTLSATDDQGVATYNKQWVGDATKEIFVREKSVPNHLIKSDEVKSVTLTSGQTSTVSFVNRLKKSGLTITKVDADNRPVAGVTFEVRFSDGSVRNVTTGANGIAEISNISHTVTSATVRETATASYLVLNTTPKTVQLNLNQTAQVDFTNEFKTSTLNIVKTDALGAKVAGVVFEISKTQDFANAEEVTTGAQGNVSKQFVMKSASQTVYVREKSVPAHLVKTTEVKTATLTPDQTATVSFVNQNKTFTAEIRKTDETGAKVSGVVFEISKTRDFSADVQTLTATNTQGVARSNVFTLANSAQFTLYVREKSVPVHLVKSTEIKEIVVNPATLNNGATFTVSFVNKLKEYPVELSKSDLSSAEPIEGVTLTIYKADDKNNATKLYESITDKSGKLPGLKLPRGKYKFIETHATIGYKINPNPHYFEVADDGTITGSTVMTDEREEYEFVVDKVDNKGNKVAGVVFSAKNRLTGEVQKATTDANGVAKFKGIWAEYEIKEEETLANLIKDEKVYVLKVNPDGSYEKLKVVNNLVEAPKTGVAKNEQPNFIAPIVAGFVVLLGGATFAFIRKK